MTADDFDEFEELARIVHDLGEANPRDEQDICVLCTDPQMPVVAAENRPHTVDCPWRRARAWRNRHSSGVFEP